MSLNTEQSTAEPRDVHRLDEARLLSYLRQALPSAEAVLPGPLRARSFTHGQSNPTYLLTFGGGGGTPRRLVLRKQPPGKLLASAHAVDREYRVLRALSGTGLPVPRPLLLCGDASVVGTPFYVMEFAAGTIHTDPSLPEATAHERAAIYSRLAETLAQLHSLDPAALGLGGFGSPEHYCRRQVGRWARQYEAVAGGPQQRQQQGGGEGEGADAGVRRLVGWLRANVPAEDAAPPAPAVVHGDFRLDNLVLDGQLGVVAVLDWELATLGNPWADVAYMCMPYHLPEEIGPLRLRQPLPEGVPTEQELLRRYCEARGVAPPPPRDWAFYLALSVFRLLSILAGVQARARQGNASSAAAEAISSGSILQALAGAALDIVARADGEPAAGAAPASGGGAGGGCVRPRAAGLGQPSARAQQLLLRLEAFMRGQVYPAEGTLDAHAHGPDRWTIHPLMEDLKAKAKAAGLWNLWVPADMAASLQHLLPEVPAAERGALLGAGLSHLDYAHLCGLMGTCLWAPEVFNCGAPDTGNMEVLARYGSREQQLAWLLPLLRGRIRSCFAMTEKAVASSDATNITSAIERRGGGAQGQGRGQGQGGGEYVVRGLKWWTSGAMDPRCKVAIFMGKTDPSAPPHRQQSMLLVPMDAPGVRVVRPLTVFGYDDAPHGHAEVSFEDVVVPGTNLLLGEGRGFEIAQGRLGPGRLHHCMRLVGMAERALALASQRALSRVAFGRPLAAQGGLREVLARQRVALEGARLLVLNAADALDRVGHKQARGEIAAAKVAAPNVALQVIDAAIQVHGGAGVSQDFVLGHLFAAARTLRIADGPDEVHLGTISKLELEAAAGGPGALRSLLAGSARARM